MNIRDAVERARQEFTHYGVSLNYQLDRAIKNENGLIELMFRVPNMGFTLTDDVLRIDIDKNGDVVFLDFPQKYRK